MSQHEEIRKGLPEYTLKFFQWIEWRRLRLEFYLGIFFKPNSTYKSSFPQIHAQNLSQSTLLWRQIGIFVNVRFFSSFPKIKLFCQGVFYNK